MDSDQKKTALRMIPYGLYVLTGKDAGGEIAAATVNWVTQTAFDPPLLVVGVKSDSSAHQVIKDAGVFALNILGKGQGDIGYTFFKPTQVEGNTLSGQPFSVGQNGAPVLEAVPAYLECNLVETVEKGDHSIFVGEVTEAVVRTPPEGRADEATLLMKDLGEKVFYGG